MRGTQLNYQWYPGHMTKTVREIREQIRLIDLVIEIADARIPMSGRNPDLNSIALGKSRLLLLAKPDLADPEVTKSWIRYYRDTEKISVLAADLRNKSALSGLIPMIRDACSEKMEHDRKRGMRPRPVRAMVAGIPNVGKSTFINTFSGSSSLKTGNRPGVTKGNQWIRMSREVELLDTPGLLWPKFENQETGKRIAFIGSMPDEILESTEVSCDLLKTVISLYPGCVSKRYGVSEDPAGYDLLEEIGRARGCLKKGGEVDMEKAARVVLDDFRTGRLGKISLEKPEDFDHD